jgi:hypothetical protein
MKKYLKLPTIEQQRKLREKYVMTPHIHPSFLLGGMF